MAISMLKIRRPLGRLIFNMGIAIPGKTVFLIETAPWWCKEPMHQQKWYLLCWTEQFGSRTSTVSLCKIERNIHLVSTQIRAYHAPNSVNRTSGHLCVMYYTQFEIKCCKLHMAIVWSCSEPKVEFHRDQSSLPWIPHKPNQPPLAQTK